MTERWFAIAIGHGTAHFNGPMASQEEAAEYARFYMKGAKFTTQARHVDQAMRNYLAGILESVR